jgi:hypothetical protein
MRDDFGGKTFYAVGETILMPNVWGEVPASLVAATA